MASYLILNVTHLCLFIHPKVSDAHKSLLSAQHHSASRDAHTTPPPPRPAAQPFPNHPRTILKDHSCTNSRHKFSILAIHDYAPYEQTLRSPFLARILTPDEKFVVVPDVVVELATLFGVITETHQEHDEHATLTISAWWELLGIAAGCFGVSAAGDVGLACEEKGFLHLRRGLGGVLGAVRRSNQAYVLIKTLFAGMVNASLLLDIASVVLRS